MFVLPGPEHEMDLLKDLHVVTNWYTLGLNLNIPLPFFSLSLSESPSACAVQDTIAGSRVPYLSQQQVCIYCATVSRKCYLHDCAYMHMYTEQTVSSYKQ